MELRILTKRQAVLIGLLLGLPIGCVITLFVMGIALTPSENPRFMKFGDITISAIKERDANDQFAEELVITKDSRPFSWMSRNSLGEVTDFVLADGMNNVILALEASPKPGRWVSANYGPPDLIGESYHDEDFDGNFDIKLVLDNTNNTPSRYIYFKGTWKKIDRFQKPKAFLGSDIFTFYANSGWQLDETDDNGGHDNITEMLEDE